MVEIFIQLDSLNDTRLDPAIKQLGFTRLNTGSILKCDFNFWPKGFRLLPEKPTCDHGGQDGKYPHPRDIAGVGSNDLAAIDFFSFGFFCIHWAFFGESCQIM